MSPVKFAMLGIVPDIAVSEKSLLIKKANSQFALIFPPPVVRQQFLCNKKSHTMSPMR
jgi:hypothetical protein